MQTFEFPARFQKRDSFWNDFSATPSRFGEAAREHYAKLYALPGAMHSGFAQFAAGALSKRCSKCADAGCAMSDR
jgi:hypothetical protein